MGCKCEIWNFYPTLANKNEFAFATWTGLRFGIVEKKLAQNNQHFFSELNEVYFEGFIVTDFYEYKENVFIVMLGNSQTMYRLDRNSHKIIRSGENPYHQGQNFKFFACSHSTLSQYKFPFLLQRDNKNVNVVDLSDDQNEDSSFKLFTLIPDQPFTRGVFESLVCRYDSTNEQFVIVSISHLLTGQAQINVYRQSN